MKRILFALAAGIVMLAGCTKALEERMTVLEEKVASLEEIVAALDREADGINTIVSNLQKKVYVTEVQPVKNATGMIEGYKIIFTQGDPVIIYNGETGPQGNKGDNGLAPGIDMYEGVWYWRYIGGDWILDSNGQKIPAVRKLDFEVGEDGHLYVTVEGGSKIDLGNVKGEDGEPGQSGSNGLPGEKGEQGDSWFDGVTVDEETGTVVISVKDSEHDIVLPLYQFNFNVTVPEVIPATAGAEVVLTYSVGEPAAATTIVRAYPSKGLEAEVDRENKTVTVTLGTVSGYVDLYAINNATGDIKAQTVEFEAGEIVTVNVTETELVLSPDGKGSVQIPVSTAYQYDVVVPSWATATVAPATKAVRDEVITVAAAGENTTANDYKDYVILKDKETSAELFKIALVQKNYLPELIADEDGNAIEWAESFDIYRYESDMTDGKTPNVSQKGVFTISLSDDFSKGVYKISNMFYADVYFAETGQPVYNKGGEYYADIEGNMLTVKRKESLQSYGFTEDFDLVYDPEKESISMTGYVAAMVYYGSIANRTCYLTNYVAKVKVEAPVTDSPLAGEWTQTVAFGTNSSVKDGAAATATVTVSGDQVTIVNFVLEGVTATGTLTGNTISIAAADSGLPTNYGPVDADIVITVSDDNKTMTAENITTGYGYGLAVTSWTAVINEAAASPLDKFAGTYSESYTMYGSPATSNLLTISVENGKLKLDKMFNAYGNTGTYEAELSEDGATLTIVNEVSPISMGSILNNVLTVSEEGGKMVLSASGLLLDPYSGTETITNYKAVQN